MKLKPQTTNSSRLTLVALKRSSLDEMATMSSSLENRPSLLRSNCCLGFRVYGWGFKVKGLEF